MTDETRSSYRQIVKATSIFGGVQAYQILVSLVRSKLVAVLLGTQGMGISGLLVSSATLMGNLTNLGLGVSAVRNVAEAHAEGNPQRVALVASVIRRLVWMTGISGAALMFILAPWLSQWTFGNNEYAWSFRIVSITVMLASVSSSYYVVLQGMRKLAELARANAAGATLGLVISIPLYYVLGIDGIVPSLVLSGLATWCLAIYFGRRAGVASAAVRWTDVFHEGKGMVKMGVLLSLSGLTGVLVGYLTNVFISRAGSVSDVGLFSAGFAMVNTYVGMIFTAMGTDYYPRLSAVAKDSKAANQLVNQQAEMALLILGPILGLFLVLLEYAIRILYSADFLGVAPMVQWSVLAIFLKAAVWSMGFLLLAHKNSRVFFISELLAAVYTLLFNVVAYYWWGMEGLGISFLAAYVLSLVQTSLVVWWQYRFTLSVGCVRILVVQLMLGTAGFWLARMEPGSMVLVLKVTVLLLVIGYSAYELQKRVDVASVVRGFFRGR